MPANFESIEEAIKAIGTTDIVSCPSFPAAAPGIITGAAYASGDEMGTLLTVRVPRRGVILSATLWDLDDEGLQYDLEIFKASISEAGDNNAWSPGDGDMLNFVTEIAFAGFDDQVNSQTSEVNSIGKAYTAPQGKFYIKIIARGAHNIAAGNEPRLQLQIQSFDPGFREG
jgi:hypothetical protein